MLNGDHDQRLLVLSDDEWLFFATKIKLADLFQPEPIFGFTIGLFP